MRFEADGKIIGVLPDYDQEAIRNEPMLFSASVDFAKINGGPITNAFLYYIVGDDWIVDSKTVMLMRGMFPCIPGWHHDDVPRTRADGQPNYDTPEYRSEHIASVVGDASLTEYISQAVEVPEIPIGRKIYQAWDRYLEALDPLRQQVSSGDVVSFSWQTFHRGMKATKNGWRFFIRASRNTTRPFKNEIRKQVQVYLDDASLGW